MRIITGEYRGRRLESPIGYDVRPTTDKVKEAIFNIIMNDIWDATCVDLFAGTGNLGLEALSRGAKKCYFGDNSRESLNLIKANVKMCRAEDKSVIIAGDYTKTLSRINEKIDIFFLDPPYKDGLYENCLELIDELDLLSEDGIVVAEHGIRDYVPEEIGRLEIIKQRKYGKIMVTIYAEKNTGEDTEEEE
ncbi:MAG: 16S rRNA (guanine(966)-N(2))-methyltransferase RsmD [Eubacteriaceae bacterium]|nr:16S rRNA (guanine(966)-N(2))-methyltransferase RsmD [Eubacteriaceae bacterium]